MDRIMILDDDLKVLRAIARDLRGEPYEIEFYSSVSKALRRAQTAIFDLIMCDVNMPELDGVSFLCAIRDVQPSAVRIILSGGADSYTVLSAVNDAGIFQYLVKPWNRDSLRSVLRQGLELRQQLLSQRHLAERAQTGIVTPA